MITYELSNDYEMLMFNQLRTFRVCSKRGNN